MQEQQFAAYRRRAQQDHLVGLLAHEGRWQKAHLPTWGQVPQVTRELNEGILAWRSGRIDEAEAHLRGAASQPQLEQRYQ